MTTPTVTTCVSLTLSHVPVPASSNGAHPEGRHLVGLGILVAQRDLRRGWRFDLHGHALSAGRPEEALLEWAADRLPGNATFIGWQVDHGMMPMLLDAAATAKPEIAQHFLVRLHRLLSGGVVDLAVPRGGAAAPPFVDVAAEMAISAPRMDLPSIFSAWATGRCEQHQADLEAQALALWRVFTRDAGMAGLSAEAATEDWLRRGKTAGFVCAAR